MEKLLGRTVSWEPSRKLKQRNFEFLENVASFTDSGLNAKKFSKPFSTNVGVERDFPLLTSIETKKLLKFNLKATFGDYSICCFTSKLKNV